MDNYDKVPSGNRNHGGHPPHGDFIMAHYMEDQRSCMLYTTGSLDSLRMADSPARIQRQKDGSFAPGYNIQVVTDLDTGVIVSAQPVDAGNDAGQFEPQASQAQAVLREVRAQEPAVAAVAADGAYHDTKQLVSLEAQEVARYVPEDRNTQRAPPAFPPRRDNR